MKASSEPIAIDIFSGAGGLSLGFETAGFRVVQAIDNSRYAAATYRQNHPHVDFIESDIQRIDHGECLKRIGLSPGALTVLIAGPPCQGFSESNRRTRTLDNPSNMLFREFIRFLKGMKPSWFVLENVAGLQTLSKGVILKEILQKILRLGYMAEYQELNAVNFGVPQFRRRIFIVGNRLGLPIVFPKATHGEGRKRFVPVREAISDLPVLPNGANRDFLPYKRKDESMLSEYQKLLRGHSKTAKVVQGNLVTRNSRKVRVRYKHIRPGSNWEVIPRNLMDNYKDPSRCHTGIYYRLEWRKPSKVIGNFRKNMLIHPSQERGLSVREAARIQSFPDKYIFLGSIGFQQQQAGDTVPPLLAFALAKEIASSIQ